MEKASRKEGMDSHDPVRQTVRIVTFSNRSSNDRKLLKRFVGFHWDHYRDDALHIPLLDYEYLGFKAIGIKGFFEPGNLFFRHADMRWLLAFKGDEIVGRCTAFVNHNHNRHWNDKVGFFGQFESTDDIEVAKALWDSTERWLGEQGMDTMRGPQDLPVNEATPGFMTDGFDSRPVIYYAYTKPYYPRLAGEAGFEPIKRVFSWEVPVMNPMEEKLERVARKVVERYGITIESWDQRSLEERINEMFGIYNEEWSDNYGFVPFEYDEFASIIKDMMLIFDKKLFVFLYIEDEPVAFFGGIPNILERLKPIPWCRRCELLRAAKMLLTRRQIKGFRVGYLGVKKKYRRLGLDGVMLWKQKCYTQAAGYEYGDMGWVLEDNVMAIRLIEMMGSRLSKTYTIFQKAIG